MKRSIGLDVHRDRIYITVLSTIDGSAEQYEISTQEMALEDFVATLGPDDQVALEATRGSHYYVKLLSQRAGSVSVANPAKMRFFSGLNAKNDRNDSFSLACLLALGMLPTVWMPDQETRDDREILHHRVNLIKDRTRHKNRARALMAENGMNWSGSELKGANFERFTMKLKARLSANAQMVLADQLEQIEVLDFRLKEVEDIIRVRAARWREVPLLMTIRGVDVLTAFTIMATIGRIDRFPSGDSLANYAGLVPSQRSSAGKSRNGKITKAGSRMLRWALTEAVQSLCRTDGPYRNLCKRLGRKNKGKGKAATACARKLLTAIWCMLTRGETFRHSEPTLVANKILRREQRLRAARKLLAEKKQRTSEAILNQLALVQELSVRRTLMPVPRQLLATFGRRSAPVEIPAAVG
jgi:transposase